MNKLSTKIKLFFIVIFVNSVFLFDHLRQTIYTNKLATSGTAWVISVWGGLPFSRLPKVVTSWCLLVTPMLRIGRFLPAKITLCQICHESKLEPWGLYGIFSARQHICYSALYAIARPSVPLSVTRVDQSKTVTVRITQPSPQSSPMFPDV